MDLENKYGTLEIQKELLKLLKEFDEFCQKEDIKYSLSSGSLLGAVRHKGFIPWDDDLDCLIDRANFNRLKKAIAGSETIKLENCTESSLWTERCRFIKSDYTGHYSPTLDVFIFDNCPDNKIFASIKMFVIRTLQGMIKYSLSLKKGGLLMKASSLVTYLMGRPFSHKTKYRWYTKVAQWGNNKSSKYMKVYHDQWTALNFSYPCEILKEVKRFEFEDTKANGFVEYDKYLRIIYGDNYMTPPSEENRVPIHI